MAAPPAVTGPAAGAMRDLLASLPDERQRNEGLTLLDRLIHGERACGGRLAHLAHVYPNLSMPSSMVSPNTPPLGFTSGWGSTPNDQSVSWGPDEGKMGYEMEAMRLTKSSFNPLALSGSTGPSGPPMQPQSWPNPSWIANGSPGVMSMHIPSQNGSEDRDSQSSENNLGWAGIVKDLELEGDSSLGPQSAAVTESRILSFVLPPVVLQVEQAGVNVSGHTLHESQPELVGKLGGGGDSALGLTAVPLGGKTKSIGIDAGSLGSLSSSRRASGGTLGDSVQQNTFSAVVSQKASAPSALGAGSPTVGGEGAWNGAAGEPLVPAINHHTHSSNGCGAMPLGAAASVVGTRVGSVVGGPGVVGGGARTCCTSVPLAPGARTTSIGSSANTNLGSTASLIAPAAMTFPAPINGAKNVASTAANAAQPSPGVSAAAAADMKTHAPLTAAAIVAIGVAGVEMVSVVKTSASERAAVGVTAHVLPLSPIASTPLPATPPTGPLAATAAKAVEAFVTCGAENASAVVGAASARGASAISSGGAKGSGGGVSQSGGGGSNSQFGARGWEISNLVSFFC